MFTLLTIFLRKKKYKNSSIHFGTDERMVMFATDGFLATVHE